MATTYAALSSRAASLPQTRPAMLPVAKLAAFASLTIPVAAVQLPLGVYLPAIYAQHYGLSLGTIAAIFLVAKFWGALTDPLVGSLTDRTRSRFGRRRPWIVAGAILFAAAGAALFFPPAAIAPAYLAGALFTLLLGVSMIQIPFLAWSGELTGDYGERTRVATYIAVGTSIALLAVLLLPTIVDQWRPDDAALKLATMGGVILLALAPALWLAFRAFPEAPPAKGASPRLGLLRSCRVIVGDRLLLRILLSDFAVGVAQNVRGTLFVFFVGQYMGLPRWASALFLFQFVFGIAAGPIWMRVAARFGKHRTAVAGELAQVAINLGLLFLVPGQLPLLLGLTLAQGLAQGSGNLMLMAMVADVADRHRLATGHDRTALFFSVFSISMKAAMAVAVGIALPLVAWAGFDPARAHNTPAALHMLLLVFALGPALAHLAAAALVSDFPLDADAHAEVRRALDARAALA